MSHAMPILQAVFHAETKLNYVRLFQVCCEVWAARHPEKKPLPEQLTLQLHKDFHPSIEEARLEVFPLSRACDDFFHMKEKCHTTMQAKCKQLAHGAERQIHQKALAVHIGCHCHSPVYPDLAAFQLALENCPRNPPAFG
jgi:hypothetical protein